MKLISSLTLILSAFSFIACSQKTDKSNIRDVFKNESFDPAIIRDLNLYDSLKTIIVSNIDTIFNFRNEKSRKNGSQHDEEWFNFNCEFGKGSSSDDVSLETLPAFIYPRVDGLIKKLGPDKIVNFDIQRNKIILNIILKSKYDEERDVETQHTLDWDWDHTADKDQFQKDTILTNQWIYYIQSYKRPG